jgi:REP element-mobilizing transposase RayT
MRAPHKHLRRLDRLWVDSPVFFITACTSRRRPILANDAASSILKSEWETAPIRHGWNVARFVIMPDHVHFFCAPKQDASSLESFIGQWKQWTAKRLIRELNCARPVWQPEFFDHLLRSEISSAEKWEYVYYNPVRAGLVTCPQDWPYSGEIISDP